MIDALTKVNTQIEELTKQRKALKEAMRKKLEELKHKLEKAAYDDDAEDREYKKEG
jgi:hypothetical protein